VYTRGQGRFILVVEVKNGTSGRPPGQCVGPSSGPPCAIPAGAPGDFDANRPDVQGMFTMNLGGGEPAVCDNGPPPQGGGIPGFPLDEFFVLGDPQVTAALQDLSCKFENRGIASSGDACTRSIFGIASFQGQGTVRQYCFQVPQPSAFQTGETIVGFQVRDTRGNLGPRREIVVRVLP